MSTKLMVLFGYLLLLTIYLLAKGIKVLIDKEFMESSRFIEISGAIIGLFGIISNEWMFRNFNLGETIDWFLIIFILIYIGIIFMQIKNKKITIYNVSERILEETLEEVLTDNNIEYEIIKKLPDNSLIKFKKTVASIAISQGFLEKSYILNFKNYRKVLFGEVLLKDLKTYLEEKNIQGTIYNSIYNFIFALLSLVLLVWLYFTMY